MAELEARSKAEAASGVKLQRERVRHGAIGAEAAAERLASTTISAAGARNVLIAVIAVRSVAGGLLRERKHRNELNAVHAEEGTRALALLDKSAKA
jgi:hypothetical protein